MIAQCEFRREFGIHRNRAVPLAHAIKTWVRNFEATGSALKKKDGGRFIARQSVSAIHWVGGCVGRGQCGGDRSGFTIMLQTFM